MEIKINNLIKRYGSKTAVDIPDFTLHEGEILGLVGNNGAGKTTLFRLMLDLLQADSGTVCMNGTDVARSEEWKTFTGAYMDESFLIDYLTPDEYFQFNGRMCGLDRNTVNERIRRYERFLGPEILEERSSSGTSRPETSRKSGSSMPCSRIRRSSSSTNPSTSSTPLRSRC